MTEHCKDCCCARSWKALGIARYTGKSIPEHISELRSEIDRLKEIPQTYITRIAELEQDNLVLAAENLRFHDEQDWVKT